MIRYHALETSLSDASIYLILHCFEEGPAGPLIIGLREVKELANGQKFIVQEPETEEDFDALICHDASEADLRQLLAIINQTTPAEIEIIWNSSELRGTLVPE